MGWNTGYTIFEATVIGAYDLGKLDKELLKVLMEPYRDTDIDSGGSAGLQTKKEGLLVEEVVLKVWGLEVPKKPENDDDDEVWEEYWDVLSDRFDSVTKEFGW